MEYNSKEINDRSSLGSEIDKRLQNENSAKMIKKQIESGLVIRDEISAEKLENEITIEMKNMLKDFVMVSNERDGTEKKLIKPDSCDSTNKKGTIEGKLLTNENVIKIQIVDEKVNIERKLLTCGNNTGVEASNSDSCDRYEEGRNVNKIEILKMSDAAEVPQRFAIKGGESDVRYSAETSSNNLKRKLEISTEDVDNSMKNESGILSEDEALVIDLDDTNSNQSDLDEEQNEKKTFIKCKMPNFDDSKHVDTLHQNLSVVNSNQSCTVKNNTVAGNCENVCESEKDSISEEGMICEPSSGDMEQCVNDCSKTVTGKHSPEKELISQTHLLEQLEQKIKNKTKEKCLTATKNSGGAAVDKKRTNLKEVDWALLGVHRCSGCGFTTTDHAIYIVHLSLCKKFNELSKSKQSFKRTNRDRYHLNHAPQSEICQPESLENGVNREQNSFSKISSDCYRCGHCQFVVSSQSLLVEHHKISHANKLCYSFCNSLCDATALSPDLKHFTRKKTEENKNLSSNPFRFRSSSSQIKNPSSVASPQITQNAIDNSGLANVNIPINIVQTASTFGKDTVVVEPPQIINQLAFVPNTQKNESVCLNKNSLLTLMNNEVSEETRSEISLSNSGFSTPVQNAPLISEQLASVNVFKPASCTTVPVKASNLSELSNSGVLSLDTSTGIIKQSVVSDPVANSSSIALTTVTPATSHTANCSGSQIYHSSSAQTAAATSSNNENNIQINEKNQADSQGKQILFRFLNGLDVNKILASYSSNSPGANSYEVNSSAENENKNQAVSTITTKNYVINKMCKLENNPNVNLLPGFQTALESSKQTMTENASLISRFRNWRNLDKQFLEDFVEDLKKRECNSNGSYFKQKLFSAYGKKFICELCKKILDDKDAIKSHIWWHFHVDLNCCSVCSKTSTENSCAVMSLIMSAIGNCDNCYISVADSSLNNQNSFQKLRKTGSTSVMSSPQRSFSDVQSSKGDNGKRVKQKNMTDYVENKSIIDLTKFSDEDEAQCHEVQTSNAGQDILNLLFEIVTELDTRKALAKILEQENKSQCIDEQKNTSAPEFLETALTEKIVINDKDLDRNSSNGAEAVESSSADYHKILDDNNNGSSETDISSDSQNKDIFGEGSGLKIASTFSLQLAKPSYWSAGDHKFEDHSTSSSVSGLGNQFASGETESHAQKSAFYICGFENCMFFSTNSIEFKYHLQVFHSLSERYPCAHCGGHSSTDEGLLKHMFNHTNTKLFLVYRCAFHDCRFGTNLLSEFKDHNLVFHHSKEFPCFYCNRVFSLLPELLSHLKSNLLKFIQCPHCSMKDRNRRNVLDHMSKLHPGKPRQIIVTSQIVCKEKLKELSSTASAEGSLKEPLQISDDSGEEENSKESDNACTEVREFEREKSHQEISPVKNVVFDPEVKYCCLHCGKNTYMIYKKFIQHLLSKHGSFHVLKLFKCRCCHMKSTSESYMTEHCNRMHKRRKIVVLHIRQTIKGKDVQEELLLNCREEVSPVKICSFHCEHCEFSSNSKILFDQHSSIHVGKGTARQKGMQVKSPSMEEFVLPENSEVVPKKKKLSKMPKIDLEQLRKNRRITSTNKSHITGRKTEESSYKLGGANLHSKINSLIVKDDGDKVNKCLLCCYSTYFLSRLHHHLLAVHLKVTFYHCYYCMVKKVSRWEIRAHCRKAHKSCLAWTIREPNWSDLISNQIEKYEKENQRQAIRDKKVGRQKQMSVQCIRSGNLQQSSGKNDGTKLRSSNSANTEVCQTFSELKNLKKHERFKVVKVGGGLYKCSGCIVKSYKVSNIQKHIQAYHQNMPPGEKRKVHRLKAKTDLALENNLKRGEKKLRVNDKSGISSKIYEKSDENMELAAERIMERSGLFLCPLCSLKSPCHKNVKRHIWTVHMKVRRKQCPYCYHSCWLQAKMDAHVQAVHTQIKTSECRKALLVVKKSKRLSEEFVATPASKKLKSQTHHMRNSLTKQPASSTATKLMLARRKGENVAFFTRNKFANKNSNLKNSKNCRKQVESNKKRLGIKIPLLKVCTEVKDMQGRIRKYLCKLCSFVSGSKKNFERHIFCHKLPLFSCSYCEFYSGHSRAMVSHHIQQIHKLPVVVKKIMSLDFMLAEMKKCDKEKKTIFKSEPVSTVGQDASSLKYCCCFCSFKTEVFSRFSQHISMHNFFPKGSRLFCMYCQYTTRKFDSFENHVLNHLSKLPFGCRHCGYSSANRNSMQEHNTQQHPQKPLSIFNRSTCDRENPISCPSVSFALNVRITDCLLMNTSELNATISNCSLSSIDLGTQKYSKKTWSS